jgi:hypothetical protein
MTAAFIAGGFALVFKQWWLFWLCAGVAILCVPAGMAIGIMDDTIMVEDLNVPTAKDHGSAADPGVRVD